MEDIQLTTLPNGLRVVTSKMSGFASATLGVWVGTGARAEEASINGAAHYLEHMAFKGTTNRTARDIALEVEDVGGYFNAYTSRENTAYFLKILQDDMPMAVDILSDILLNPTFIPEEMERERGVIQQEIGQSLDTPEDIVYDYFQEAAFPDQPLGRPILGTSQTVQNMPREALIDFMKRRYVPKNMVLAGAGAIDHEELVKLALEKFSPLADQDFPTSLSAQYKGLDKREQRDSEQVHFKLGFEGVSFHDEDRYAAKVLSTLLGGGSSSRLFEEIREKRGLVYSVYSYSESYTDNGLFGIYAGTGEKEIQELVPVLCDSLLDCQKNIQDDELKRAKAQLKSSLLMGMESSDAQAGHLGMQQLIYNDFITMEEIANNIDQVNIKDVQTVAAKIFTSNPTIAALGPIGKLESFDQIKSRLA